MGTDLCDAMCELRGVVCQLPALLVRQRQHGALGLHHANAGRDRWLCCCWFCCLRRCCCRCCWCCSKEAEVRKQRADERSDERRRGAEARFGVRGQRHLVLFVALFACASHMNKEHK